MNPTYSALETLRKLYIQGRYAEVVEFASANWSALISSEEAIRLVSCVRSESAGQQQAAQLKQLQTLLGRVAASIHQTHVATLLSDVRFDDPRRLEKFGFSAGSQNEEDGILVEIFNRVGHGERRFFEFGVGSGMQNCTIYFLLGGWRGGWVEVNAAKHDFIRRHFAFHIASGSLTVTDRPVTPDNVDAIAEMLGVATDLDLMSIDIDGNDFFVFQEMKLKPRVLVVEYNGLFPPPHRIVQAYDPNYSYSAESYTGCSLQSLTDLATRKGYRLVGTNLSGLNAFFVREDIYSERLFPASDVGSLYNPPRHQLAWGGAFASGPPLAVSPLQTAPALR